MPRGRPLTLDERIARFAPYVGKKPAVIRVQKMNEEGLRWLIDAIDGNGYALLSTENGERFHSAHVSLLDLAPLDVKSKGGPVLAAVSLTKEERDERLKRMQAAEAARRAQAQASIDARNRGSK